MQNKWGPFHKSQVMTPTSNTKETYFVWVCLFMSIIMGISVCISHCDTGVFYTQERKQGIKVNFVTACVVCPMAAFNATVGILCQTFVSQTPSNRPVSKYHEYVPCLKMRMSAAWEPAMNCWSWRHAKCNVSYFSKCPVTNLVLTSP